MAITYFSKLKYAKQKSLFDMESCWKGILSLFCPISGLWRRDYKLSLGASFYRQKEQMNFDRLYQEADQAMYASKKQAGFAMTIYHTVE